MWKHFFMNNPGFLQSVQKKIHHLTFFFPSLTELFNMGCMTRGVSTLVLQDGRDFFFIPSFLYLFFLSILCIVTIKTRLFVMENYGNDLNGVVNCTLTSEPPKYLFDIFRSIIAFIFFIFKK